MRYFQNFPTVDYRTTEIVNGLPQQFNRRVPNMSVQFAINYEAGSYDWYMIQDRDRPDTVAAQWYGSSRFSWVVLLSNGMKDIYDWPMTTLQFYDYMNQKYESTLGQNNGVVYSQTVIYEYLWTDPISKQELSVDQQFYNDMSISGTRRIKYFYEYEDDLNNMRRKIKRLHLSTFQSFVQQFTNLTSMVNY